MIVTKCDICKKEIEDREHIVLAGTGSHLSANSFCLDCGKPVLEFLKNKLHKKNITNKNKNE